MDIQRLNNDRRALAHRIRELKAVLGTTWTRPMGDEQRELLRLKAEATELCILRAWLRGRLHLPDLERCRAVAEARAVAYQRAPAPEHGRPGLSPA